MSFEAMSWAIKQECGSPVKKIVLMMLANRADNEDYQCWPSQDRIARECECASKTVYRALKELEKDGLIEREKRLDRDNRQRTDLIKLKVFAHGHRVHREAKPLDSVSKADGLSRPNPMDTESTKPIIEPIIEPINVVSVRVRDVFEILKDAIADPARSPAMAVFTIPNQWAREYSNEWDEVIIPTLMSFVEKRRNMHPPRSPIKSWNYFNQMLADAVASSKKPLAEGIENGKVKPGNCRKRENINRAIVRATKRHISPES